MYQNNIILQAISIIILVAAFGVLIITFIPSMKYEEEVGEYAKLGRILMILLILALMRGAF